MDMHLELVSVPVADVERGKALYTVDIYVDQFGLASSKTVAENQWVGPDQ
jgi:hypothetical protein